MIDRTLLIRSASLYAPLLAATYLILARRTRLTRQSAVLLTGFCWCLPSLLFLQMLNLRFHWWSFHVQGGLIRSMPVDLYLGWAVLWGILPQLLLPRQRLWIVIAVFASFDLTVMPAFAPVVELSRQWLVGELAAIGIVLLPAQFFARTTRDASRLPVRIWFHVLMFGGVLMFLPAEIFAAMTGRDVWAAVRNAPSWLRGMELQLLLLPAFGAVSATLEFARRGLGTPIPYDPPKRLVVSGFYRYLANPMQVFCALTLAGWGMVLRSPWIAGTGAMAVIYSAGLARWDEGEDLRERFGGSWLRYRRHVRNWMPRWRPWHAPDMPEPRLYIAEECGPCSEVRRWFEARNPTALKIVAAEDHPSLDLDRITYDPMDGTTPEKGVAAFARALEHLHLGWAWLGALLRLPVICQLSQLLLDAGGLGPQRVSRRVCSRPQTATDL